MATQLHVQWTTQREQKLLFFTLQAHNSKTIGDTRNICTSSKLLRSFWQAPALMIEATITLCRASGTLISNNKSNQPLPLRRAYGILATFPVSIPQLYFLSHAATKKSPPPPHTKNNCCRVETRNETVCCYRSTYCN